MEHIKAVPRSREWLQRFRNQFAKTKFCRFEAGLCPFAESCAFAHSPNEMGCVPDLTKTSICNKWRNGECQIPAEECAFAHGDEELRRSPAFTSPLGKKARLRQLAEQEEPPSGTRSSSSSPTPALGAPAADGRQLEVDHELRALGALAVVPISQDDIEVRGRILVIELELSAWMALEEVAETEDDSAVKESVALAQRYLKCPSQSTSSAALALHEISSAVAEMGPSPTQEKLVEVEEAVLGVVVCRCQLATEFGMRHLFVKELQKAFDYPRLDSSVRSKLMHSHRTIFGDWPGVFKSHCKRKSVKQQQKRLVGSEVKNKMKVLNGTVEYCTQMIGETDSELEEEREEEEEEQDDASHHVTEDGQGQ